MSDEIASQQFVDYSFFFLFFRPGYQRQHDTCGGYLRRDNCGTCGCHLYAYPAWSARAKARIHYSVKKPKDGKGGYIFYYNSYRYCICSVNSFNTKILFCAYQLGKYLDNICGGCTCRWPSNQYGGGVLVRTALWRKVLSSQTMIIVYSAIHVMLGSGGCQAGG